MFSLVMLFITLPVLYFIYGLLGRKLTISGIERKAVLITGCGSGEIQQKHFCGRSRLHAFQMDGTDDESVRNSRKIVDTVLKEKNLVLHALVNNAGILSAHYHVDFLTLDDYKEVLDVNLFGVIRVIQTFRNLIKNSSSAATFFPSPSCGPYCCSKFAVQAYTTIIRHELLSYAKKSMKEILPKLMVTETTSVIDAYYEATVAKRPKFLYRIGWDALFM
uniref:Uncharacterized protein n=1 Tax=Onchocerca volvulus TaxID=6282 RepID=A0A8R1XTJ3_ONCVO